MRDIIELSHTIKDGMETYRGLPAPAIGDHMTFEDSAGNYAEGVEFCIARITMVANTGTYLDSPAHRYREAQDIASLALDKMVNVPGMVIRCSGEDRRIGKDILDGLDVAGKAVLFHTGWSKHWQTEQYFGDHPYLTSNAADILVNEGAVLVGIDSYNIDEQTNPLRPVHSRLLAAGIPIVEHLTNLAELPDAGFRFFAPPIKIEGMGSCPVRAFALV